MSVESQRSLHEHVLPAIPHFSAIEALHDTHDQEMRSGWCRSVGGLAHAM